MRAAALTLELPALWRWWMTELSPLVPSAPRVAVQRRRLRPILAFGEDIVVVWAPRINDGAVAFVEVARVLLSGDPAAVAQAGRAAIESLPIRAGESTVGVIVTLPRSQVLRKHIVLPAAVEENLLQTLHYDLDRHTPFRPEQLYFDAAIVGRDPAKGEIRVDWAAALKSVVDQARRQAESWGAKVSGIAPESLSPMSSGMANATAWSRLNLLPHSERIDTTSWRRWQLWVPVTVLAIAAVTAVALPLWQKREYAVDLGQVTEEARRQAAASDGLRQQLDQATGDYNFALGKKYAFPSTMQLLDDITKLLPDDTWLTQLEIKTSSKSKEPHREMLLRGESGNAGRLISALEESKLFEQAAPRSPTTKIQPGPGEVFDLGTQVRQSPAPQLVALANLNAARASTPPDARESTATATKAQPPAAATKAGAAAAATAGTNPTAQPPTTTQPSTFGPPRPTAVITPPTTSDAEDDDVAATHGGNSNATRNPVQQRAVPPPRMTMQDPPPGKSDAKGGARPPPLTLIPPPSTGDAPAAPPAGPPKGAPANPASGASKS